MRVSSVKMMGKMINIILAVLLWSIVHQVHSHVETFLDTPCYIINDIEIEIVSHPENKYLSTIDFSNSDGNISSLNGVWTPCESTAENFDPLLTNDTLKQMRGVLRFLRLTDEEISCDQLKQLVHLDVNDFPFDYYYHIGQFEKNVPAGNQSLCEYDLETLDIYYSYESMNKVIRNESFCLYKNLKNLTIGDSDISEIEVDAFICLEHLIHIDLSYNNLSSLPQQVFSRNRRLQTVILLSNVFNSMVFYSLMPLPSVSYLDVSRNGRKILPEVIPLKRLKRLDLSFNVLREINENAFSELVELENIDLSYNELTEIYAETFRNNPEVKYLSVRGNALKSIPKIDNLSKLEVLDLGRNKINGTINLSDLFENHINLKDLILHHNKIKGIITTKSFELHSETLSNLRIDLSNNFIQSLSNVILPIRVYDFDVSYNRIQTVCVQLLRLFQNLEVKNVLYLSGNPLQCNCANRDLKYPFNQWLIRDFGELECDLVPTPLDPMKKPKVQLAKLADDQVLCRIEFNRSQRCACNEEDEECPKSNLNEHCYAFTDWEDFNIINVCENLTEIPSHGYHTNSWPNIKWVEALKKMKKNWRPLKVHMYFKNNNIQTLKLVQFDDDELSTGCVSFYLVKSNVQIIENDAFNRMTNLEILSLINNRIRVLPDNLFQNLTKLKELYLSNNRLTTLGHQTIINVIKLELHNNSLKRLPITANTNRLLLSLSNLTYLSLHDNSWSCKCDFIQPFHNYLGIKADIIQRVKEINCIDEQRNKYNALQFDLSKCKPFLHLTAITTSTTFAVVIIIIAALIFIYRREVRVLIYSRYRLRIFGLEVDDDISNKQYDAFMAYHNKDEDFLINHLMPGLEAIPNPYRLCIHERDFPAGAFIQESIMRAVELSSRTIVVLSENFVDSGWCRMEFMTAHAQMMQDRCPRVLLVVLGEIPQNLDPEIELYLRTNTYLRWGERLFWEKLYYAMPDQRVTSPPTDIMPMDDHELLEMKMPYALCPS